MKPIPKESLGAFRALLGFLEAGGNPTTPFVVRWCQTYEIDAPTLAEEVRKNGTDYWLFRLKKAGLIE